MSEPETTTMDDVDIIRSAIYELQFIGSEEDEIMNDANAALDRLQQSSIPALPSGWILTVLTWNPMSKSAVATLCYPPISMGMRSVQGNGVSPREAVISAIARIGFEDARI